MLRIKACGLSDVGLARTHNEDCFGIDPDKKLVVVADGMGGHSHGEVASRIAVQSIRDYVDRGAVGEDEGENPSDSKARSGGPGGLQRHSRLLQDAIRIAHRRVLGAIQEDGALYGMGTTVVGMLLKGNTAAIGHVGDSRAYRIRDRDLQLLTQDHTWVNEQVLAGFLSEEQARVHPLKNVITRALGGESDVVVDMLEVEVAPGDVYLLCSDGLTTMMPDRDIQAKLTAEDSLEDSCRALIQEANSRGGLDNVTVVLLAVQDGNSHPG
jgi:PPM family protein phosphatase